jgi:hypothetical protein
MVVMVLLMVKGNDQKKKKSSLAISKGGHSSKKTFESRVEDYLSQEQTWNRINETNMKENTTQVEFYCIGTKMRPPANTGKRRTSTMGATRRHSNTPSVHVQSMNLQKPIASSHIRIQQSQFMKDTRFPENCDLSSLQYGGIGQHMFRSNVIEKEPIAVYARACVIDCPLEGDRAIEVSVHVDDPRCSSNPDKPWLKARFTLSMLIGSKHGSLRLPLVMASNRSSVVASPNGEKATDKYGPIDSPDRPVLYVLLSKVPYYTDSKTSIVQTWGMQAQTFALRTINQELIVAREECHEAVTTFQVPLLYLKLRAAEWVSNLKTMKERCEKLLKIFIEREEARAYEMGEAQKIVEDPSAAPSDVNNAKKKLAALKKELGKRQSTEERSKWVISHMQEHNRIVSQYSAAIGLLTPLFTQIPRNAYMNKCISLTFKKSADKKKSALRMLPTNLHLCWWRVWNPAVLPISDDDYEELNIVDLGSKQSSTSPNTPKNPGRSSRTSITQSKANLKRTSMMPSFNTGGSSSAVSKRLSASSAIGGSDLLPTTLEFLNGEQKTGGGGDVDSDDDDDDGSGARSQFFKKSFYPDGKCDQDTVYDTVTFGAPAAHVLGFKKGGLRALLLKRAKLLAGDDGSIAEEEEQKYKEVAWWYKDASGSFDEQGPHQTSTMREWYQSGAFEDGLLTRIDILEQPNQWIKLSERFPEKDKAFPLDYALKELDMIRESMIAAAHENKDKRGKDEMRQEAESLSLKIEQRRDLIVCQALSALVLSFSARLEVLGSRSDKFLNQLAHVGYLFQVESLVSTHGDEQGMLDDFIEAMKELRTFSFRLSELGGTTMDTDLWKKRENLTQIRGKMAATTESSENYQKLDEAATFLEGQIREAMEEEEQQWYYCDDDNIVQGPYPASHMRSWYPDYLDDEVRILKDGEDAEMWQTIGERFAHCGPFPSPSIAAVRVGTGLKEISMERGSDKCVITIKVPPSLWSKLPDKLQQGQSIDVYPVLIQQGINEFQTICNLTGSRSKIQNVVNRRALDVYKEYMEKVEECKDVIGLDSAEIDIARELFNAFNSVVLNESPRRKNVEIIQCGQRITRALRGGRGICCKSAKDRTSMSLTLEQAQLLFNNEAETRIEEHDKSAQKLSMDDRTALSVANITREYGVSFTVIKLF